MRVMEKYIEQQSMIQTMSFRSHRRGSATKKDPKMIHLLQDMVHRFQRSTDEVNEQEKKSRTQYVNLLGHRVKGKLASKELRAKAKKIRESQRTRYHVLLQLAHAGMQKALSAMQSIEKDSKFQNKKMEMQNPLVPLGALESPESVMAGVSHDLHKFAIDSQTSLAQLKKTAPDVEEEVAREKMADVYIHDGFGQQEKEDAKKVKEVKANKDLKA